MESLKPLSEVPLEHCARITELKMESEIKRRIMDLGIISGSIIKPVFRSPSGDPTAFEIKGTVIALRDKLTSKIYVKEVEG